MPFIAAGLLFVLLAGAVAFREQRRFSRWTQVTARCTGATTELRRETDGTRRTLVRALYAFEADGRTVEAADPQAGSSARHQPGDLVTLAFDPLNPTQISLGIPRFVVGVVAGLGLLAMVVGTAGELWARTHPAAEDVEDSADEAEDPAEQP